MVRIMEKSEIDPKWIGWKWSNKPSEDLFVELINPVFPLTSGTYKGKDLQEIIFLSSHDSTRPSGLYSIEEIVENQVLLIVHDKASLTKEEVVAYLEKIGL